MQITLQDATSFVAKFVLSGGSCPAKTIVTSRINEAIRRMLYRADWTQTTQLMEVISYTDSFTCPREVESVRLVNINHIPRNVRPVGHRMLPSGPGDSGDVCKGKQDLRDMGDGYPTFFDIPLDDAIDYKLIAFGNEPSSYTGQIRYQGFKRNGESVLTSGVPGELVSPNLWLGGTEGNVDGPLVGLNSTSNEFYTITSIHLPAGRTDYVTIYAMELATNRLYFLGKYHPDETVPSYRRYKILGYQPDYVDKDNCIRLTMKVKLRYVPASRDDDVLILQNLDALKNMVIAIREENSNNVQASLIYEQKALSLLGQQYQNQNSQSIILNVEDTYHFAGMGQIN